MIAAVSLASFGEKENAVGQVSNSTALASSRKESKTLEGSASKGKIISDDI